MTADLSDLVQYLKRQEIAAYMAWEKSPADKTLHAAWLRALGMWELERNTRQAMEMER